MAVTAEEVRKYRDEAGVGLVEAKRVLRRHEIKTRLDNLKRWKWDANPHRIVIELIDIIIDLEQL